MTGPRTAVVDPALAEAMITMEQVGVRVYRAGGA